ncbi:glucose PTS transporter subunit IIA [Virgibacillus sp. FSP13]
MNNRELAQAILEQLNGKKNIASFTNCITRLRVNVKKRENIDLESIKQLDGVLGVIDNETIQVVLGPGKVTKVANEFRDLTNMDAEEMDTEEEFDVASDTKAAYKAKQTSSVQQVLRHIGNIFVPLVPGFVASGLLLGIANLILNLANPDAGVLDPAILESNWYLLLKSIGGLLFGSLGVFVGINTAKEFKGTLVLGGIAGLMIYAPVLNDIGSMNFFGLDLQISTGLGGLLGVVVAAYIFAKIENFIRKRTPDSLDLLLTPLITIIIGSVITLVVIQPLAGWIMSGITWFLVDVMLKIGGVLGGYVLAATFLPLVTVGMHQGLIPIHLELINSTGSTTLLPILAMAGAGQVGAAIAIYLKTKDKRLRNTVANALPVGILGIGEPLIYGVVLPLGRPFITACLGAGFGGAFLSLSSVGAISVGPSGLALIPLIADNNYLLYIAGLIISYAGGFVLTYLFGYKEKLVNKLYNDSEAGKTVENKDENKKEENVDLVNDKAIFSPLTGALVPLEAVNDEVFSSGSVGKGVAIIPTDGQLRAPVNGTVTTVFPTGHAIGITSKEGVEILMHIGLDTVESEGKFFDVKVKKDAKVEKGDLLSVIDIEGIANAGYDLTSPLVIMNSGDYQSIVSTESENMKTGDLLLTIDR